MTIINNKISNIWLSWFKKTNDLERLKIELNGVCRLMDMENKQKFRGEKNYKLMIRKKIMLQAKIKLLEGIANGW